MNCSASWELNVTVITSIVYTVFVLLFLYISLLLLNQRNNFHPFFSILLVLLFMSYALCDSCVIISNLFSLQANNSSVGRLFDIMGYAFYVYATPCIICILFERIFATLQAGKYEHYRPWGMFIAAQPICVFFVLGYIYLMRYGYMNTETEQLMLAGFYAMVFLITVVLLVINRQLTIRLSGMGCGLTRRYQLTENIRVIRVIIPVISLDGLLTVVDIIGKIFFDVHKGFEVEKCRNSSYPLAFIIIQTISLGLECLIPVFVVFSHPRLQQQISNSFRNTSLTVSSVVVDDSGVSAISKKEHKIRNVLGYELSASQSSSQHFISLDQAWSKRL